MIDKNKLCKLCKQPYIEHVNYLLDVFDSGSFKQAVAEGFSKEQLEKYDRCPGFKPMTNLDYLEWKDEQHEGTSS